MIRGGIVFPINPIADFRWMLIASDPSVEGFGSTVESDIFHDPFRAIGKRSTSHEPFVTDDNEIPRFPVMNDPIV